MAGAAARGGVLSLAQCTRAPSTRTHSCNRPFQKAVAKQPPQQLEVVCPVRSPAVRPRFWWHGINRQQAGTKPHASAQVLALWELDRPGGVLAAGSPDNQQVKPCSASAEGRQGGMPRRMGLHPCAQSCGCAVGCMPLRLPYWYGLVTFRAAPDTARGHPVNMPCASALQLGSTPKGGADSGAEDKTLHILMSTARDTVFEDTAVRHRAGHNPNL